MNAEMCTFKLLKALCSVSVTTKSESPEKKKKIEDDPGVLRLLQCPAVAPLTLALRVTKQYVITEKDERRWSRHSDSMMLGSRPVY